MKLKIRKEMLFGFGIMALIVLPSVLFMPWGNMTNGHWGLLMLALVVVAIMLGFPTAFTLMGMGVFFAWLAYRSVNPDLAGRQVLDLMVQRTYGVMNNESLLAIPLFVFMGYLVERAALIERLFKSLHLALSRVPGSLAVATIVTCAIFATATGIVGAVVTLMGLLALPAMLRAGYSVQLSAGAITAGGCLGILIPPSVLLIVYGATAGVSVVKLYAGAFFPGIMLATLYVGYVIVLAKWKPKLAPPLPESERRVAIPAINQPLVARGRNSIAVLGKSLFTAPPAGVTRRNIFGQFLVALLPIIVLSALLLVTYDLATKAPEVIDTASMPATFDSSSSGEGAAADPSAANTGLAEPPQDTGLAEPPAQDLNAPIAASKATPEAKVKAAIIPKPAPAIDKAAQERTDIPSWFWVFAGVLLAIMAVVALVLSWERLEVFKMLLTSFFPLAVLILAVLGSIVFGFATPSEAAAVGAFGGLLLALGYRYINHRRELGTGPAFAVTARDMGSIVQDSAFLTAKTTAMVCWLFVGSGIFSAAFALLGGQEIIERWVLSLGLSSLQFMILAQFIIFVLGWPLEWTEIIVIFMPIFIPLLAKFNIDPLFFGLLVALNLQTAFLSPPVAMAAFYLKGVSPPHVTLNQIFGGMMPFMAIQVLAVILLYMFPAIGMWLPQVLYK
ncbi:MAG TPA: TRAP transporter large permease subunit [Usitatibacter sp.]|nr:TRAP transporter large permease subunit [Usitatibacter sp.]